MPPVQLTVAAAPVARSPAGKVSVKLNVWLGFVVGWVIVNVKLAVAPGLMVVGENAFVSTGIAAMTVTQAPALGVTPLVALGVIATVTLVRPLMLLLVFALGASAHAAMVGLVAFVTGTMMVQVVAGLTI